MSAAKGEYVQSEFIHNSASVLVMDDNLELRRVIKTNLEDEDTRVIESAADSDSVTTLDDSRVDLILVGFRLPDLKEWSILSHIRAKESLRDTPIIVICPEPPKSSLMKQFTPNDYVISPFDVRDLVTRVRNIIGQNAVQYSR